MKLFYIIVLFLFCRNVVTYAQSGPLPYSFRENNGQITGPGGQPRADIDFSLQAPGVSIMIGDAQMHYQFSRLEGSGPMDSIRHLRRQVAARDSKLPQTPDGKPLFRAPNVIFYRLDVVLLGANKEARILREEEREETYRYYSSTSKEQQAKTVKTYGKITYKDIYPHIDWVLYTGGKDFKYDFIVHPGGKASDIRLQYNGADSLCVKVNGDLAVTTPAAVITEQAPIAYIQDTHDTIPVSFKLNKHTVTFNAGYAKGTLVIDPGVDWATYLGGAGGGNASAISTDNKGNVYLCGGAGVNANIITSGAYQTSLSSNSLSAAFLAKINSAGNLVWGTYVSGTGGGPWSLGPYTQGNDVACDGFGHVYLTASTWCDSGLATPGAFQSAYSLNAGGFFAPVLMQFSTQGQLKWATYYGASTANIGFNAITCDGQGNVYAGGYADSTTSTTNQLISIGAWQTAFAGGIPTFGYDNDGLLVKFDSSGNRLWATYYGGSFNETINAIACDSAGAVYLTGATCSADNIATPGTFQPVIGPDFMYPNLNQERGGFVAKFSPTGQRLWGSYINALGHGICINPLGQLYISGIVNSSSDSMIASPNAYLSIGLGERNDFLMRFNPSTGQRIWGTYYGGEFQSGYNIGNVSCDSIGNVFLSGPTNSRGAPGSLYVMATPGSHQDTLNAPAGVFNPNSDAYVAMFDSSGSRKWATYYGGSGIEYAGKTVVDYSNGALYLCGYTTSDNAIATPGSFQNSPDTTNGSGSSQGFLVKFLPLDIALDSLTTPLPDTLCAGNLPLSVHVRNGGKMTKTDPLVIYYAYTGPINGNGTQTFSAPMAPGAAVVLNLGTLPLTLPGLYNLTVYLRYTKDDNNFDNDTLHVQKFIVVPPSAAINQYFVGNVYHFNNYDNQPGNTYHWDFGDGSTSALASEVHTYPDKDSSFLVVLTVTNACGSSTDSVRIQTDGSSTGIDDPSTSAFLKVYPNPAQSFVRLEAKPGVMLQSFDLVDAHGSVLRSGVPQYNKGSMNLESIQPGLYLLRINTSKGTVNKKLVLVK